MEWYTTPGKNTRLELAVDLLQEIAPIYELRGGTLEKEEKIRLVDDVLDLVDILIEREQATRK